MNTITKKQRQNKIKKIMAIVLFISVLIMGSALTAFADGANEASDALTELANYIFDIGRIIGVLICFFGLIQVGQSLSNHDPSQRTTGFFMFAGGVIIVFAKEILELIGVTL